MNIAPNSVIGGRKAEINKDEETLGKRGGGGKGGGGGGGGGRLKSMTEEGRKTHEGEKKTQRTLQKEQTVMIKVRVENKINNLGPKPFTHS